MHKPPRFLADIKVERDLRRHRRLRFLRRILLLILLVGGFILLSLCSCSTDDDRDGCCEGVILTYRYVRQQRDEYRQFVHTMRHFLFDESGRFVREIPFNRSNLQQVRLLQLLPGRYTVVTVGNATAKTSFLKTLSPQYASIREFKLSLANLISSTSTDNTDELLWNTRTFNVERNKLLRYVCDLSNIHCHLFVKVFWNKKPPYTADKYTMQLEGVPVCNTLDPAQIHTTKIIRPDTTSGTESTDRRVVHTFPGLDDAFGTHRTVEALYGAKLYGEFVTLRYSNEYIPTFRLYYGKEAVTKPIDLAKAFASWGWRPDDTPEQLYRIEMEIFDDGTVVVNQWAQTSVKDWQDGGTVDVHQ